MPNKKITAIPEGSYVGYYPDKITRNEARKKGDFKLADKIRIELLNEGVLIEDKKDKTNWKYK